ncbi:MAG TPA: helix-turn-helix domain-containing protein [Candidatus Dormibacteraeota bacterium]
MVLRPRRSRCASCLVTHVLLPTLALLRRRDLAEVIGEALHARFVEHKSRAKVAEGAGVYPVTARRWWARFEARAEQIRAAFTVLAHDLDASLGAVEARGSPAADALEAIGVAGAAAARRFGPAPLWGFVAGASGGLLLANTNCDLPPPG